MVELEKTYYKRDVKCTRNENRETCCKRIHKCKIEGDKHVCTFYKNEKCIVKIIDIKLPKHPATCISSGDPHYTTFNGRRFDYYKSGDFLLLESQGFTIHTRLKPWLGVSVNTGFAARVNKAGETIECDSGNGLDFLINGKERVTLKHNEKHYFTYGGYVESIPKSGFTLIKVVSASGDFMEVQSYKNFGKRANMQNHIYNIVVKVQNSNKYYSGFCVNPTPQHVTGIFSHEYKFDGKPMRKKKMWRRKKKRNKEKM